MLVSRHPHFRFTLNGHVLNRRGYFRLMQFLADRQTVRVKTYSPWLDRWMTGPEQQFELLL